MTVLKDHDDIVRHWVEASPQELSIPPDCFYHMDTEFIEWSRLQKRLIARFPLKTAFRNPRKFMQGGFVVAALDNVLGPLSYLSGMPSVTTQLNTSFIRPVSDSLDYIEIVAVITDSTKSAVYSNADAYSPEGKLLSSVQATSHIVRHR